MADDLADWSLGRLLSTAARRVEHAWNRTLAERDLTHAGLVVLQALSAGAATQRELARSSRVEEQTMARVLERLERTGHITRSPDPADRRRRLVTRTAAGEAATADLAESDVADRLVAGPLTDPAAFRAELVRLIAEFDRPG